MNFPALLLICIAYLVSYYKYQWYKDEDILSEETSSEIIVTKSDADTDDLV